MDFAAEQLLVKPVWSKCSEEIAPRKVCLENLSCGWFFWESGLEHIGKSGYVFVFVFIISWPKMRKGLKNNRQSNSSKMSSSCYPPKKLPNLYNFQVSSKKLWHLRNKFKCPTTKSQLCWKFIFYSVSGALSTFNEHFRGDPLLNMAQEEYSKFPKSMNRLPN